MLSACLSVVFTLYVDAILAITLHNDYAIPNNLLGVYFLLASITYVIGAPLASWMSGFINRRYIILAAFILMAFQSILNGPSYIFGL